MSKSWISESGDVVHPDAPQGSGGPGIFTSCGPLGCEVDLHSWAPHPHSPEGRYLALNEDYKKSIRQRHSAGQPAKLPTDDAALNAKIKEAADALVRKPAVGSGECYDLANSLLTNAGAKSAPDFGRITDTANYAWGTSIRLNDVKGGDILQFRDHKITVVTVQTIRKTFPDGSSRTEKKKTTTTQVRPHHTAVVSANDGGGILTIVEQHVEDPDTGAFSAVVQQNKLFLNSVKPRRSKVSKKEGDVTVEEETTVTITVSGKIWAYRPRSR